MDNSSILDLLNGTKERLHAVKGDFMKIMQDSGVVLKWLYIKSTTSPFLGVRMYKEGKKGRFSIVYSDENGRLTRSGIHCGLNVREAMSIFKEYGKQIEAYDNR